MTAVSKNSVPQAEFRRAKLWRERLGLTWAELGRQLGYSRMAIYWFETGLTPPARGKSAIERKIKPWVWQRYKLACAGFAAQLASRKKFEW